MALVPIALARILAVFSSFSEGRQGSDFDLEQDLDQLIL
jgi:hypothetical protein